DVMMPEIDGNAFLKKLRQKSNTPILMLSALSEIDNKIESLEKGADDYLTKPFDPKELLLRIKSILRRTKPQEPQIKFGNFTFDLYTNILHNKEDVIELTSSETLILSLLGRAHGEPVSRELIAHHLNIEEGGVNVQILRLRKKIDYDKVSLIETIRHKGYRLRIKK
ncbi:MAG: response regulator transcription factor, partial [Alphaproteobacteria bacterium]